MTPAPEPRLLQRCRSCATVRLLDDDLCRDCGSPGTDTVATPDRGTVVSWTTITRATSSGHRDRAPYLVLLVELPDGPWVLTRAAEGLRPSVGQDVRLDLVTGDDGVGLTAHGVDVA